MNIKTLCLTIGASLLMTPLAFALMLAPADVPLGNVEINHAYAYATPKENPAAIFMSIENHGANDRMIDFVLDDDATTELHTMTMHDDVMRMRRVDGYDVNAHTTVMLTPAGHHIMIFNRTDDWNDGDSIQAKAVFENLGAVPVTIHIKTRGAKTNDVKTPEHMHHGHH